MATRKRSATTSGYIKSPEAYGDALANVCVEGDKETILGQAWLAGHNQLVTCGHVVDAFLEKPDDLVVKFPASGNRYRVAVIKLHPSFLRQKDQLVKYDAAVLEVELHSPESEAEPLPIRFERPLQVNQSVFAVRYPAHLGLITAAPNPLSQRGHILGTLRKHDPFHLLHDLALAQGDSGAPILDGGSVVAIHCGDTASLPGLNLPTTSIRLALWIDALRELAIKPTAKGERLASLVKLRSWSAYVELVLAFLVSSSLTLIVVLIGATAFDIGHHKGKIDNPTVLPVRVTAVNIPSDVHRPAALRINLLCGSDARGQLYGYDSKNIYVASNAAKRFDLKANQDLSLELPIDAFRTTTTPASGEQSAKKALLNGICLIVAAPDVNVMDEQNSPDNSLPSFLHWLEALEEARAGKVFHQFIEIPLLPS
jgi:hypothetical protein